MPVLKWHLTLAQLILRVEKSAQYWELRNLPLHYAQREWTIPDQTGSLILQLAVYVAIEITSYHSAFNVNCGLNFSQSYLQLYLDKWRGEGLDFIKRIHDSLLSGENSKANVGKQLCTRIIFVVAIFEVKNSFWELQK